MNTTAVIYAYAADAVEMLIDNGYVSVWNKALANNVIRLARQRSTCPTGAFRVHEHCTEDGQPFFFVEEI